MISTGSLLNVYMYESKQLLGEFTSLLSAGQKAGSFSSDQLATVMRILHTIKGSSAMLGLTAVTGLVHSLEDVYAYLNRSDGQSRHFQAIINLSYRTVVEIEAKTVRLRRGDEPTGDASPLTDQIHALYSSISSTEPDEDGKVVDIVQAAIPGTHSRESREATLPAAQSDSPQFEPSSPRMAEIAPLFFIMEHLVGGLAAKTGKKAAFYTLGKNTRLDKRIQNKLADPLMHIVRNAMDHGIEPKSDRVAAGKNPTGRVTLKAHRHGDTIVIMVLDDGRGLDKQALIAQAIALGQLAAPADDISDAQAFELIFGLGISTKSEITALSGRGIGMNAARDSVTRLGGTITASSTPRRGTCIKITVPQTLFTADETQHRS